jgi:hypothetical protein
MKKIEWVDTPDKDGYWWFKGVRHSRTKRYIAQVSAPVKVEDKRGFPDRLVFYPGSGTEYGVKNHEGKWVYLGDMFNE